MRTASDSRFADALFRLLASIGLEAVAVYRLDRGTPRLQAASPGYLSCRSAGRPPSPPLPAPDAAAIAVAPAEIGLACSFAAVAPVTAGGALAGILVAADLRPRRLTAKLARSLADAAALAAAMVPPPPPAARLRPVDASLSAAIRSRATAQRLVGAALRGSADGPAPTLFVLDLDRFRAVNEALGSAAGDALLAVTGARLQQTLEAGDRLVRLEGDRFALVARRDPDGLQALAERLLAAVNQPLVLRGRTLTIQASIGMVTSRGGAGAAALMMQAEVALRRAKAGGRERFAAHEPADEARTLEKSRLELDLVHAAARGEMRLVYQPYVDLVDGSVSGAEALLRWRHPGRGELQPAAFIPLAEATGLILPLGRWALRAAMARAAGWPDGTTLSVNISPLQFHRGDFLVDVDAALADTGFPPERLELEITETVLMRDNPETTAQLRALIGRGIRIALDDFGTGYSALAYLARLPHHRIKLDKAFVQDLANPATAELIRAIIALARAQGVAITAEGVERPEHLALVRRMGFTHAQGFAIGAPAASALAPPSQACSA